jgi:hypothetical protein
MRVDKVIEKLAKTDKAKVSLEALPDGKIRANTSAWGDAKVLLRNEVLEVRTIDGQLRLAQKERFHDDGEPPIEQYDPYGPHVTGARNTKDESRVTLDSNDTVTRDAPTVTCNVTRDATAAERSRRFRLRRSSPGPIRVPSPR